MQLGVVIFFSGLLISWANSWSAPPPPRSPSVRAKGSPQHEQWDESESEIEDLEQRPRRESLWEEAEIEGLDVGERTEPWDPDAQEEPASLVRLRPAAPRVTARQVPRRNQPQAA